MRKIILYIAISLDGKIARSDGDISWLEEFPKPDNSDYGYSEFLESIDTTLMGNNTYRQLLKWGIEFPYSGKHNYVFTRNPEFKKDINVTFISQDHVKFVKELRSQLGKDIWLIGGGELNALFLSEKLIDEMIIFIIPIVLGEGIPLFRNIPDETILEMVKSSTYSNGVIEINYRINHA